MCSLDQEKALKCEEKSFWRVVCGMNPSYLLGYQICCTYSPVTIHFYPCYPILFMLLSKAICRKEFSLHKSLLNIHDYSTDLDASTIYDQQHWKLHHTESWNIASICFGKFTLKTRPSHFPRCLRRPSFDLTFISFSVHAELLLCSFLVHHIFRCAVIAKQHFNLGHSEDPLSGRTTCPPLPCSHHPRRDIQALFLDRPCNSMFALLFTLLSRELPCHFSHRRYPNDFFAHIKLLLCHIFLYVWFRCAHTLSRVVISLLYSSVHGSIRLPRFFSSCQLLNKNNNFQFNGMILSRIHWYTFFLGNSEGVNFLLAGSLHKFYTGCLHITDQVLRYTSTLHSFSQPWESDV